MGLDITAYSKTEFVCTADFDTYEARYASDTKHVYACHWEAAFAERAAPIVENGIYRVHGETFDFAAGSYSGYNYWRDWLSRTILGVSAEAVWADRATYRGKPFFELIDFSDAEGIIGSIVAAKLARDFKTNSIKAQAHADPYYPNKYRLWQKAFALAADNGFVEFH